MNLPRKILTLILTAAICLAPWHGNLAGLTGRGRRALHGWLNPQPVTTVTQAPTSHEDFGRPVVSDGCSPLSMTELGLGPTF